MSWALAKRARRRKYALENNPCAFVPKLAKERARDRVYSDDELKALWKAFETIGVVGDVFKLQLLTAARPGEVSELEWGELDLTRAMWTQPSARTKNPKVHVVPLCAMAVRILEGLQKRQAGLEESCQAKFAFRLSEST
jgi:integrase